jgi:hypothetical protein
MSVLNVEENRFNVVFLFTVCVLSAYFTDSLIPSNLLVKIKCTCLPYNESSPVRHLVGVHVFCYLSGKQFQFIFNQSGSSCLLLHYVR